MAEKEAEGELGGSLVEGRTAGCWGVGPREERRAAARWVAQTVARWAMVAGVAVAVAMAVAVAVAHHHTHHRFIVKTRVDWCSLPSYS